MLSPMRLADFIEQNTEPILLEWVEFAKSAAPAAGSMDASALRDHAVEMLKAIVVDLRTPQSSDEQAEKSKGKSDGSDGGEDTAAEAHGSGRAVSGFTIGEMVSEYRALRASVIQLWTDAVGSLTRGEDLDDLMRFNEAIDQAIAESITRYTEDLDHSKEMFLAILGHDLRSPLGAVIMAAQFMLETEELEEPHLTLTTRIVRSSKRMNRMVSDLLDFTRSRLGSGVPVVRAEMNLEKEAENAIDEVRAARTDCTFELAATGDLKGYWDCARISQVLANLLGNAVQHGVPKAIVNVTLRGEPDEVVLQVHNRGRTIPPADLPGLFSPFKRLTGDQAPASAASSLGLGLYIAERIVTAHGGKIGVESSDTEGTTFTVHLPRAED